MTETVNNVEKNHGYICAYTDTDSMAIFPTSPFCKPVRDILPISERLGELKIEKENILRLVGKNIVFYYIFY